jgi:hypothetical protein
VLTGILDAQNKQQYLAKVNNGNGVITATIALFRAVCKGCEGKASVLQLIEGL